MTRSLSPVPRRQIMLGVSAPSSFCSDRKFSLQPAWINNCFRRMARSWLFSGMVFIRCRTADFSAGANWTFCPGATPQRTRLKIVIARDAPRMVRLSYTLSAAFEPAKLCGFEGDLVLGSVNVSPGNFGIVGKNREPFFGNCACVIALAILQHLEWKKIIGHGPDRVEVPGGGNQIRNIAGGPSRAAKEYAPHVARVPGPDLDGDSRRYLGVAFNQLHLAGLDQRIVIGAEVAYAIALQLQRSVLPLAQRSVVLRLGERGDGLPVLINRIPAAVIKMKMGIDDDIDLVGGHAGGGEVFQQFFLGLEDLLALLFQLVADPGFDQKVLTAGAHQHGVAADGDAVERVGLDLLFPHNFRDDAEESAAIGHVSAVRDRGQLKVTESDCLVLHSSRLLPATRVESASGYG